MHIHRVEVHEKRVVLNQPNAWMIRVAAKAMLAVTNERPLIGITGFFPESAVKSGRFLDLRPLVTEPCEQWNVYASRRGGDWIGVEVLGEWEEVIPEQGENVVVTLEMP